MPGLTIALRWVALPILCASWACPSEADEARERPQGESEPEAARQAPLAPPPVPPSAPAPEDSFAAQAARDSATTGAIPPSAPAPDDPSAVEPARYSAATGTVRVDPFGCGAVTLSFEPPPGFELDEGSDDATWSRAHGSRDGLQIQAKAAWLDFVGLSVVCDGRPDAAQRRAANAKRIHVDQQPEHPFERSGAPEVRVMRQRYEVLTDRIDTPKPVLEYRNTFPDGAPPGFIYDHYEGRCWHHRADAGLVLALRIHVPLAREAEARTWLASLCERLATATITATITATVTDD